VRKQQTSAYMKILRELRERGPQSLYLLTGEDGYLIDDLVSRLRKAVLLPDMEDLDAVTIDCEDKTTRLDLDRLRQDVSTPPFLSSRRLVTIRRSAAFRPNSLNEQDMKRFLDILQSLPQSVCLIFIEDKVDRRQRKLIKAVETHGVFGEIKHESAQVLTDWIRAVLSEIEVGIHAEAAENLIDRCESDMRQLSQELKKIKLYCEATGVKAVDVTVLDEVCIPDMRGTVFNITDAVSIGNVELAIRYLHVLFARKEPAQLILFMLARHFKQLMLALESRSDDDLRETARVHPFVAKRLRQQVRRFSWPKLEAIYKACFETDVALKTGLIDERTGLEILLAQAGRAATVR
jgi:DNA polymerase-3 subunit delta